MHYDQAYKTKGVDQRPKAFTQNTIKIIDDTLTH